MRYVACNRQAVEFLQMKVNFENYLSSPTWVRTQAGSQTEPSGIGQFPGAHLFRGPTPIDQTNLKRAQIVAKIEFTMEAEGVSVRPWT